MNIEQGCVQVPVIVGKEDEREITVVLAGCTLLPPQLIYPGKTPGLFHRDGILYIVNGNNAAILRRPCGFF